MAFEFNSSIITKRRLGTSDDPFVSLSEAHTIENSVVQLSEIPDEFTKVTVTGQSILWSEQSSGVPSANTYVVDYINNLVTFHSSREGLQLQFDFKGTGLHYVPMGMIYTKQSDGDVLQTLEEVIDNADVILDSEATRVINENLRITGYQEMINTSKMILKTSVASYSNLATTYPNPSFYWTVRVIDTSRLYRYDGNSWVYIDTILTSAYDELVMSLVNETFDCGIFGSVDDSVAIDCGTF